MSTTPFTASHPLSCLDGGGLMGELMRSFEWSKTPLGPVERWPQSLRTTVSTCINSRFPIVVWWGPEFVKLYNDAYITILGDKHPHVLGQPGRECWPEIWDIIGPMLEGVLARGEATWSEDQMLPIARHGYVEECYFTFSYSPIRDESGGVGGVFTAVTETTERVLAERRLGALRTLAEGAEAKSDEVACARAMQVLADHKADIPFAQLYMLDDGDSARLVGSTAEASGLVSTPREPVDLTAGDWASLAGLLRRAAHSSEPTVIDDLGVFGPLPPGPWPEPTRRALALPVTRAGQPRPYALLIAGVSSRRGLDAAYWSFFTLVAGHIATSIASARTYEEARQRAEELAALDRAKTVFFGDISHELRTPLTLVLGPLEEALAPGAEIAPKLRENIELAHRSALRLLRLVNTILDFSRIEAGRAEVSLESLDLAELTFQIVSTFAPAIERAGLRLNVDCPPLPGPVLIDPEIWEKIVLNLLSNAFKHTFEGGIEVSLRAGPGGAVLAVRDTGVGIAEEHLPRIFERFHRVRGARSRTHEGTGIGLALVHELVKLHGGSIHVESRVGVGSTFRVTLPMPDERVALAPRRSASAVTTSTGASPVSSFLAEALRWSGSSPADGATAGERSPSPGAASPKPADGAPRARVLLADDNADMRAYVSRILSSRWEVETVEDGEAALAAARTRPPDLVLSDVMMPKLDGFALLRALRESVTTRAIPVVLLSARAGEEATIEGLDAGADDYLIKPFTARELIARVRVNIEAARARAEDARRKDEFLAMLAHELRNPLAPMRMALHLMRAKRPVGAPDRHLDVLDRQTENLTRLVDDLLDVARITRGKIDLRLERLEVASLVTRAVDTARVVMQRKRHALTVTLPDEPIFVRGDAVRLEQVLVNLLVNAAKYTDPGGHIWISAERAGERGEKVAFRVRDDGVGIAKPMLDRIFTLFQQIDSSLERAQGGLGIGLTIVRSLVELHGGEIEAKSDGLGHGSEFSVRLPVDLGEAKRQPDVAYASRILQPGEALTVLVVDDNDDAAETLGEVLRTMGHQVRVAPDGPTALRLAAERRPDVVFLDIGLPGMDGYEVARRLRETARPVALVALTGYGQESDRREAIASGFTHHITKPAPLERLAELLDGLHTAPRVQLSP